MTEFMPAEVFPVAAGIVIGLGAARLRRPRSRLPVTILLSAVAGFEAAEFTGDVRESWAFLVFDVGQVLVAALVTSALLEIGAGRRRAEPEVVRKRGDFRRR